MSASAVCMVRRPERNLRTAAVGAQIVAQIVKGVFAALPNDRCADGTWPAGVRWRTDAAFVHAQYARLKETKERSMMISHR